MEGVVPGVKSAEGSTSHGQGLLVTLKAVLEAFQRLNHSIQYRQLFLKFFWEGKRRWVRLWDFFFFFGLWDLSSLTRD